MTASTGRDSAASSPLERQLRADFVQTRLADYLILVRLGPARVPVDWNWQVGRGAVFSHAGTDLWGAGLEHGLGPVLTERCIAWATGETPCA
jgi:hypothetical protein